MQHESFKKIVSRDYSLIDDLPRQVQPIAVAGRGIAREGSKVFKGDKHVGYVTSGTMVPMWSVEGEGLDSAQTDQRQLRSICLAYVDSDIIEDDKVTVEIRGKAVNAVVVPFHMRSDAPPYVRPIIFDHEIQEEKLPPGERPVKALKITGKSHGEHQLATAAVHQPHSLRNDGLAHGPAPVGHGPGVPVRRAQEGESILRRRDLLLSGDGIYRRGRTYAGKGDAGIPRL